jgi:hypothetical protein
MVVSTLKRDSEPEVVIAEETASPTGPAIQSTSVCCRRRISYDFENGKVLIDEVYNSVQINLLHRTWLPEKAANRTKAWSETYALLEGILQ